MKDSFCLPQSTSGRRAAGFAVASPGIAPAQDTQATGQGRYVVLPPRLRYGRGSPTNIVCRPGMVPSIIKEHELSIQHGGHGGPLLIMDYSSSLCDPAEVVITSRTGSEARMIRRMCCQWKDGDQQHGGIPFSIPSTTYVPGGVDVGTTQYIDAYNGPNFLGPR